MTTKPRKQKQDRPGDGEGHALYHRVGQLLVDGLTRLPQLERINAVYLLLGYLNELTDEWDREMEQELQDRRIAQQLAPDALIEATPGMVLKAAWEITLAKKARMTKRG